jgi:transcriptional regulator with XRE-family HTH domain
MTRPKVRLVGGADEFVGRQIRERRLTLGLTQQQFAELIGVTYQQAHKYECGINRVSAGRLYEIACILHVPITYFYEGLGDKTTSSRPAGHRDRMLLEVTRNFPKIQDEKQREALHALTRILAGR